MSASTRTFASAVAAHLMVDCLGSVWPIFKTLAQLDLAWAGLVATSTSILSFGLQPLFGHIADRGHRRRLVRLGCALVPLTTLLGPLSRFPPLMHHGAGYALMGLIMLVALQGSAMFHPPTIGQAAHSSAGRGSTLLALFIACGQVGVACSQMLFSAVWHATGRHTEILLIPAGAILLWLSRWFHPPETAAGHTAWGGRRLLRPRRLPAGLGLLWLIQVLVGYAYGALTFLLPEFVAFRGYPAWWIQGGSFALLTAGSALLIVPMGHMADRFGHRSLLRLCLACGAGLFYLAVLVPKVSPASWATLMMLAGGVLGSVNPLCVSLGQKLAPGHLSLVSGLLMGLAWAVSSPTSWLVGLLAERMAPSSALAWMGLALAGAALLAWPLPPSAPPTWGRPAPPSTHATPTPDADSNRSGT